MEASVRHLAKFASDIWQIHPFCEGNTRATAVFMIKYMKAFGFRIMHVDYVAANDSQSANIQIPKCQFGTLGCTLEELALLELIVKNPNAKQQELADASGKSLRTIKRLMKSLQDKNHIRRKSGKRYGKWEVFV